MQKMLTTRKAILIHNPNLKDRDSLNGTKADMDAWEAYLKEPIGGFWSDSEIVRWDAKDKQTLLKDIESLKNGDEKFTYVFFAFSGHGYRAGEDDYICTCDSLGDAVNVQELKSCLMEIAEKGSIILDACRDEAFVYHNPYECLYKGSVKEAYEYDAKKEEDRAIFHFDFFTYISEDGFVLVQSCQPGKTASEGYIENPSEQFGNFSHLMIEVGKRSPKHLSVYDAFVEANKLLITNVKWNGTSPQQGTCSKFGPRMFYPFSLGTDFFADLKRLYE